MPHFQTTSLAVVTVSRYDLQSFKFPRNRVFNLVSHAYCILPKLISFCFKLKQLFDVCSSVCQNGVLTYPDPLSCSYARYRVYSARFLILSIPYEECEKEYLSQSKCQFGTRLKEPQKPISTLNKGKSALAEHGCDK